MSAVHDAWRLRRIHRPVAGESYNGYVARVAALEGHPSTAELNRLAGLEWPQRTEMAPACVEGMPALARTLGIDVRELEVRAHAALSDGGRTWRGAPVERRALELAVRRFSPGSLAASGHHRALWCVRAFPFCEESWEFLIDRCPDRHCGAVQRFYYPAGPTLCDRCGASLIGAASSPVPPELRDRLRMAVGLLHHDPARTSESSAALPAPVRGLPPGGAFALLVALARAWEPALPERRRTIGHGVEPELLTRAVAEAWTLLEGWPASFERLAAERIAGRSGRFDDGNGGATLRFILGDWHVGVPGVSPLILDLRSRLEANLRTCASLDEVLRASGTRPTALAKLRREGRVETVFALDGGRAVPLVAPASAAAVVAARRASVLIEEAATRLGMPAYGIEQLCVSGTLEWTLDPLPCEVRGPVRVEASSLEELIGALSGGRGDPEGGSLVHLDRVMLGVGGGPKPWGAVARAMATGTVRHAVRGGPASSPVMRRILVHRDDVSTLRGLAIEGGVPTPSRAFLTRGEAGEILNLRKASQACAFLAAWPARSDRRPVVPATELMHRAARTIHAPELAERFGLTTSGVGGALASAGVDGRWGGFDRSAALHLVEDALAREEAMIELARRTHRRPSAARRLLRRVDERYRPRGRARATG